MTLPMLTYCDRCGGLHDEVCDVEIIKVPPGLLALCRDPHALDHMPMLDIDAVHRSQER